MSLLEFCSSAVNTRHFIIFNYGGFSSNIFSLSSIFFNNPFILLEVKCKYKWLSDWRADTAGLWDQEDFGPKNTRAAEPAEPSSVTM